VSDVPEIHGSCDARFARVRSAFAENFRDHGELGAAVAIEIDGKLVVDVWAGWADAERTRPWRRDTLVNVFSVGKGMVALSVLMLVDRGEVDLDAPVARYWPEFAAGGKSDIAVRTVLCHQAGLPAIRRLLPPFAMYDWHLMTAALAAEEPWWEPGSQHGYHVNTFGFLAGEIVRRVAGEGFGDFFRTRIAGPLDADFHFGTAPRYDERTAEYVFGDTPKDIGDEEGRRRIAADPDFVTLLRRVYENPPGLSGLGTVNTREWRAAVIPSTNGHATARGVARIYGVLARGGAADGIALLHRETLDGAIVEASCGVDAILGRPSRFGLGFQLTQPERPLGPNPRTFGHFGAGGSLGFADPDAQLAFAYTMNRAGPRWQNPCNRALIDALYACL
jgi:CubicO group peptidase (beta-lactamase class C family)